MKSLLAAALVVCFAAHSGKALAYACNKNYYVNSSGHLVHSPSCGEEQGARANPQSRFASTILYLPIPPPANHYQYIIILHLRIISQPYAYRIAIPQPAFASFCFTISPLPFSRIVLFRPVSHSSVSHIIRSHPILLRAAATNGVALQYNKCQSASNFAPRSASKIDPILETGAAGSARPGEAGLGCAAGASADRWGGGSVR